MVYEQDGWPAHDFLGNSPPVLRYSNGNAFEIQQMRGKLYKKFLSLGGEEIWQVPIRSNKIPKSKDL